MASTSYKFDQSSCVICLVSFHDSRDSDVAEVGKGLNRLIEYSVKHNDNELIHFLQQIPLVVKVHNSCCRNYSSKRVFDQKCAKNSAVDDDTVVPKKSLRSSAPTFDWKTNCFLCGQLCAVDKDIRHVMTVNVKGSVIDQCQVHSDAWGLEVLCRINSSDCVRAGNAVYYKNCHRNFYRISLHDSCGRPVDNLKLETFEKL